MLDGSEFCTAGGSEAHNQFADREMSMNIEQATLFFPQRHRMENKEKPMSVTFRKWEKELKFMIRMTNISIATSIHQVSDRIKNKDIKLVSLMA